MSFWILFLAPALTHRVTRAQKNLTGAEFCPQLCTCVAAPLGLCSCCSEREQLSTYSVVPIAVLLAFEMCNF